MPFISRVRRLLSSLAKDCSKDAWDELAMRPIRDAAQAPEFTADTIKADPVDGCLFAHPARCRRRAIATGTRGGDAVPGDRRRPALRRHRHNMLN